MMNFEGAKLKLTNTQLNKLKSSAKYKTVKTLRVTKKDFQDEKLPYALFITTRKKNKKRFCYKYFGRYET